MQVSKESLALLCEQCVAEITSAYEIRQRIRHFDQAYFELLRREEENKQQSLSLEEKKTIGEENKQENAEKSKSSIDVTQDKKQKSKNIPCDVCQKTFYSKHALRNHFNAIHLKQKRYSCDCGRGFSTCYKRNLENHNRRFHFDPNQPIEVCLPFVCPRKGCGRRFAVKQDMTQHSKFVCKE